MKLLARVGRTLAAVALAALVATPAVAAEDFVPDEAEVKKVVEEKAEPAPEGKWDATLAIGGSIAFGRQLHVVGAPTDKTTTWTLGGNVAGTLEYVKGKHQWANALNLNILFQKAPPFDEWIKGADSLSFSSTYYFKAQEWIGLFGQLGLLTAVLPGYDYRTAITTYSKDGVLDNDGSKTRLTGAFQPFILKQSLGAFVRPFRASWMEIEARAGLGARETFADGAYRLADNADTADVVELASLDDSVLLGAELGASVKGVLASDRITYGLGLNVLLPFYDNLDNSDAGVGDLTNVEFNAGVGFKLVEWASLDYKFLLQRIPQVTDEIQYTHNLLLTFGWKLLEKDEK